MSEKKKIHQCVICGEDIFGHAKDGMHGMTCLLQLHTYLEGYANIEKILQKLGTKGLWVTKNITKRKK